MEEQHGGRNLLPLGMNSRRKLIQSHQSFDVFISFSQWQSLVTQNFGPCLGKP